MERKITAFHKDIATGVQKSIFNVPEVEIFRKKKKNQEIHWISLWQGGKTKEGK